MSKQTKGKYVVEINKGFGDVERANFKSLEAAQVFASKQSSPRTKIYKEFKEWTTVRVEYTYYAKDIK